MYSTHSLLMFGGGNGNVGWGWEWEREGRRRCFWLESFGSPACRVCVVGNRVVLRFSLWGGRWGLGMKRGGVECCYSVDCIVAVKSGPSRGWQSGLISCMLIAPLWSKVVLAEDGKVLLLQ